MKNVILTKNWNGKLAVKETLTSLEEQIHIFHNGKTLEEIKEDCYPAFVVAEYFSNFPRLHLITARNEGEALQAVYEYLSDGSDDDEDIELSVSACIFE